MVRKIGLLLFGIISLSCYGKFQNENDREYDIYVSDILNELKSQDEAITFKDKRIFLDDFDIGRSAEIYELDTLEGLIYSNKVLQIQDCEITGELRGFRFRKIIISNSTIIDIEQTVQIIDTQDPVVAVAPNMQGYSYGVSGIGEIITDSLIVVSNRFQTDMRFEMPKVYKFSEVSNNISNGEIHISGSFYGTTRIINNDTKTLNILSSTFEVADTVNYDFEAPDPYTASFHNFGRPFTISASLTIKGNHSLNIGYSDFKSELGIRKRIDIILNGENLVIDASNFDAPVNIESIVNERLNILRSQFNQGVSINKLVLPEHNSYFPFDQLKMGLVVFANIDAMFSPAGLDCKSCVLYSGEYDLDLLLSDPRIFDWTYKHYYNNLLNSYNLLYNNYRSRGEIISANDAYIAIKELELTRLRTTYFVHGGFNNLFRWKLSQLLKIYTNHGTNPATAIIASIYVILFFAIFYFFFPSEWDVTSKSKLLQNYKDFIQKNDKGYAKPFMMVILGFGISLINALTLSLNSFTTLGFGTIPTKGLARYVCIIQGFIGWFLLSIFTVALINQVLA